MPDIATTPMPTDSSADVEHELSGQLRADVRLLSTLLGKVLRESGSPRLFDDVEALRSKARETAKRLLQGAAV